MDRIHRHIISEIKDNGEFLWVKQMPIRRKLDSGYFRKYHRWTETSISALDIFNTIPCGFGQPRHEV
jgi:hypothetical protein